MSGTVWVEENPDNYLVYQVFVRCLSVDLELPGVERHAHNCIDAKGIKVINLLLSRDAAGGRHAPSSGIADGEDGREVGAAHQPFAVDVRIKKLTAERL